MLILMLLMIPLWDRGKETLMNIFFIFAVPQCERLDPLPFWLLVKPLRSPSNPSDKVRWLYLFPFINSKYSH